MLTKKFIRDGRHGDLAIIAGLCFLFAILTVLISTTTQAAPILDSYGRVTGFTDDEKLPIPEEPVEVTPQPPTEEDNSDEALIDALRAKIKAKDTKIQNLQKRADAIGGDLDSARGRKRSLSGEVAYLNRQIDGLEVQIQITESRIESVGLRVEQLNLEIELMEEKIAVGHERLAAVLRNIQTTEDKVGPVELVFAAQPFSEVFDALRESELLDSSLSESLRGVKKARDDVEVAREAGIAEREESEKLRDELRIKQVLLANEEAGRDELLTETRQEEATYETMLAEVEAAQREIEQEISGLESQLRQQVDPTSLPGAGVLSWPVKTVRITQGYGSTTNTGFINDVYGFHNGYDMGAIVRGVIGDPIYAAADGKVVGVGSDGRYAYGRWVAVSHSNGLITLYAHLSLQLVSVGQSVERGEVIARMGSTGFSTAAHLHFTVYAANTFRIEPRWYGPLPIGASFDPSKFL